MSAFQCLPTVTFNIWRMLRDVLRPLEWKESCLLVGWGRDEEGKQISNGVVWMVDGLVTLLLRLCLLVPSSSHCRVSVIQSLSLSGGAASVLGNSGRISIFGAAVSLCDIVHERSFLQTLATCVCKHRTLLYY